MLPSTMRGHLDRYPDELRRDHLRLYTLTYISIIQWFLGTDWIERYIHPETANHDSYLLYPSDIPTGTNAAWFLDAYILSDALYNLQKIPGFDHRIDQLLHGQISSTISEFIIAKILRTNGWLFQFVDPLKEGRIGQNFDMAVNYEPNRVAFIEVESKDKATIRSVGTIKNTLDHAMRQLPKDQPGIIFVQIPQDWLEEVNGEPIVTPDVLAPARSFLRNCGRVVMLGFFTTRIKLGGQEIAADHAHFEMVNPRSRFVRRGDWTLLGRSSLVYHTRPFWFNVNDFARDARLT